MVGVGDNDESHLMFRKVKRMKQLVQKISAAMLMLTMAATLLLTQNTIAAAPGAGVGLQEKTPHQIVEQATKELFASVKKYNAAAKKSDEYYADITRILDSVVDFPFIAKAVMRKSGKSATPEQIEKFTAVFKSGLVKTYAKGIANYADSTVKTLPSTAEAGARRLSVDQDVSDKGDVHRLSYTMAQNKAGEWKLINVVLNGVNLGDSFTSQFDQAMIKYTNDIDKVNESWLSSK